MEAIFEYSKCDLKISWGACRAEAFLLGNRIADHFDYCNLINRILKTLVGVQ